MEGCESKERENNKNKKEKLMKKNDMEKEIQNKKII